MDRSSAKLPVYSPAASSPLGVIERCLAIVLPGPGISLSLSLSLICLARISHRFLLNECN